MKAQLETTLVAFAQRNLGVVPRGHLFDLQFKPWHIRYLCDRGRLERVFESVYRIAGTPRSWHQRLLAACWAGGVRSYGSHRSAATVWGLPGAQEVLEITSPRWRRARHPGVTTHETLVLDPLDFTVVDGAIPVTRPARTILDMCAIAGPTLPVSTIELAFQECLRRNLLDIALIGTRWHALGGERRPGGTIAKQMIERWLPNAARTDSRPENLLLQIFRDAGLPDPVPQYRVWTGPGECVDLDFAWPSRRAGLEFNSYRYHGGRMKFDDDARRALRVRMANWELITVTDAELDAGCPNVVPLLKRLLRTAAA